MFRSLTFAYPTSDAARRFGYGKCGCYVVTVLHDDGSIIREEPHLSLVDATRRYDAMTSLEPHRPTCMRSRFAEPVITAIRRECCYGACELYATYSDGKQAPLFAYYLNKLAFSDADLIGKTETEALALRKDRETAYLQS